MKPLTPEQEEWLATRPPHVAAVVRAKPGNTCYRRTNNRGLRGHYWIVCYDEHPNSTDVSLTIAHGADSFLPGAMVFGVEPDDLTECDCGRWGMPSQEQIDALHARIEIERAYRKGGPNVG